RVGQRGARGVAHGGRSDHAVSLTRRTGSGLGRGGRSGGELRKNDAGEASGVSPVDSDRRGGSQPTRFHGSRSVRVGTLAVGSGKLRKGGSRCVWHRIGPAAARLVIEKRSC